MLDREPFAGAAESGLDLVDDEQRAALLAELLRGLEKLRRADVDAALALYDFEHDGSGLICNALVERRRIVELHVRGFQQWHEAFAVFRLPRDRQRADGPAMKPLGRGDKSGPLREQTSELQRAIHRFGAAVGEKGVRQMLGQYIDEGLSELGPLVVVEIIGAQRQRSGLFLNRRRHARMAMPEHGHALRGSEIEVLLAVFVVQPTALTAGDDDVAAPSGGAAEDALLDLGVIRSAFCLLHVASKRCVCPSPQAHG